MERNIIRMQRAVMAKGPITATFLSSIWETICLCFFLLEIAWKETWEKSDTDCYIYWEEREQICFLCFRKYAHMNM